MEAAGAGAAAEAVEGMLCGPAMPLPPPPGAEALPEETQAAEAHAVPIGSSLLPSFLPPPAYDTSLPQEKQVRAS